MMSDRAIAIFCSAFESCDGNLDKLTCAIIQRASKSIDDLYDLEYEEAGEDRYVILRYYVDFVNGGE